MRSISLAPPFPGLCRFKQGRNFQQWTGNDSKALMKVFMATIFLHHRSYFICPQVWMSAIEGFVPRNVVWCFHAYLDFCYIARMSILTRPMLNRLNKALKRFHSYRTVFQQLSIRESTPSSFSLPRQHAVVHYRKYIENFGAPNGLCSSITESKHMTAIKRPWHRSSRYNAIKQIMQINQRMEKLTTAHVNFTSQGILTFPTWQPRLLHSVPLDDEDDQSGASHEGAIHNEVFLAQTHGMYRNMFFSAFLTSLRIAPNYPRSLHGLGQRISHPNLSDLVQNYLLQQACPDTDPTTNQPPTAPPHTNPSHAEHLKVFHSTRTIFCAPSNPSTATGMHHETIQATPSWNQGEIPRSRYNCVFISNGENLESNISGLLVAQILLLFSFMINEELDQCALIHWFSIFGDQPDPNNGMWIVTPDYFVSGILSKFHSFLPISPNFMLS